MAPLRMLRNPTPFLRVPIRQTNSAVHSELTGLHRILFVYTYLVLSTPFGHVLPVGVKQITKRGQHSMQICSLYSCKLVS